MTIKPIIFVFAFLCVRLNADDLFFNIKSQYTYLHDIDIAADEEIYDKQGKKINLIKNGFSYLYKKDKEIIFSDQEIVVLKNDLEKALQEKQINKEDKNKSSEKNEDLPVGFEIPKKFILVESKNEFILIERNFANLVFYKVISSTKDSKDFFSIKNKIATVPINDYIQLEKILFNPK